MSPDVHFYACAVCLAIRIREKNHRYEALKAYDKIFSIVSKKLRATSRASTFWFLSNKLYPSYYLRGKLYIKDTHTKANPRKEDTYCLIPYAPCASINPRTILVLKSGASNLKMKNNIEMHSIFSGLSILTL